MVAGWGDDGRDRPARLVRRADDLHVVGLPDRPKFREELDGRFAQLYHDLERGTDAMAYVDPYADIESFRRATPLAVALVELVQGIMDARAAGPPPPDGEARSARRPDVHRRRRRLAAFSGDTVTGMFISMMFAGHHTTSGTAAWTLIELLRHPTSWRGDTTSWTSSTPTAPRSASRPCGRSPARVRHQGGAAPAPAAHPAAPGGEGGPDVWRTIALRPASSWPPARRSRNRIPEDFPDPDAFVPSRYLEPREEDRANPWTWIPFGAGRHRCVGAAFAMMQLKAIFSVLLQGWEFEPAQPLDSYRNDHSKMVVQLQQPCRGALSPAHAGAASMRDRRRPRPVSGARRL